VRTQNGRVIGKAALVSLTLVGLALTLSAYALTVGWGLNDMDSFAKNGAPGVVVFHRYLGVWGAVALVVLAVNSAMAVALIPNLVALDIAVEVMNALLLPLVLSFLVALAIHALPPEHRLRGWYLWLVVGVSLVTAGLGVYGGITSIPGW